jgi:hypothetical protein
MSRFELTNAISRTPEWIGHVVDGLYVDVFGRAADPSGRAYWSNRILGGARVADVAASLFGSAEYYKKAGGTNGGYVDALYRGILGRAPDSGGLGYWVGELDRLRPREDLSRSLFLSYESNTSRVNDLYSTILKRAPDGGGRDYWARQLFSVDDIVLAALLASSDEYFYRSIR